LPIKRFVAANNSNDIVYQYLKTGRYNPRPSVATIANAMDVGNPSNFARILELYSHSYEAICKDMTGATYSDAQIEQTLKNVWDRNNYLLDPHGACGYQALADELYEDEVGVFLETAHPAKFKDTIDRVLNIELAVPEKLQAFMIKEKNTVQLKPTLNDLKQYLLG
jgi:threonine synthase